MWGGPLEGGDLVVALVNRGNSGVENVTADLSLVLESGVTNPARASSASQWTVRDVWKKKNMGTVTGTLQATVPPHDIAIFRLTPQ